MMINDDSICNITMFTNVITFCSKSVQAPDIKQQDKLAFQLEPDFKDTVVLGKK